MEEYNNLCLFEWHFLWLSESLTVLSRMYFTTEFSVCSPEEALKAGPMSMPNCFSCIARTTKSLLHQKKPVPQALLFLIVGHAVRGHYEEFHLGGFYIQDVSLTKDLIPLAVSMVCWLYFWHSVFHLKFSQVWFSGFGFFSLMLQFGKKKNQTNPLILYVLPLLYQED